MRLQIPAPWDLVISAVATTLGNSCERCNSPNLTSEECIGSK